MIFSLKPTRIALLAALLTLGLILCLMTACDGGSTPADTTTADTTASTEAPTDPVTEAPTEETTTEEITTEEITTEEVTETETELKGWEPDMGKFNDGKVDYVKNEDGSVTATPREG